MSNTNILNFSLGPVQSFIARARKTRDFWAGSFLLSYLTGQAMAVILKHGGALTLPAIANDGDHIEDPLLQAIYSHDSGRNGKLMHSRKLIATLPNRFRAEIPAGFNPDLCEQAVKQAWQRLTEIIWDRYLAAAASCGCQTSEIWCRQIESYWEVNWVLGAETDLLDLRKNWRSHLTPVECGDKCTLFGEMQELSGYMRQNNSAKQKMFWEEVRKRTGRYEIDENERLCSIALVKRLFPLIAADVIAKAPTDYPSTPYLAAINWLHLVVEKHQNKALLYAKQASKLPAVWGRENPTLFPALQQAVTVYPQVKEFASLDGNCFFKASLENGNLWDKTGNPAASSKEIREKLVKKLGEIIPPCSPFYAMLLMDGDRLGALLQEYEGKTGMISCSLNEFSLGVASIIESENGITVFAGGDDLLALLPLENALSAATRLRYTYRQAFADKIHQATISGAIVYAHFTTPLTEVYHEAHRLLDEVAKEQTGRDSLAVTVWKRSGRVLTWSAPWDSIITEEPYTTIIDDFMKYFHQDGEADEKLNIFTSSFFYNLQSRFALFTDEKNNLENFKTVDLKALLTAEYIKCRGITTNRKEVEELMEKLLKLCRRSWRNTEGQIIEDSKRLQLTGAFLAKFLVEKGVER